LRIDDHFDAVDARLTASSCVEVLDFEFAAHLQELEVRAHLELLRAAAAHARFHR
jgi:hypothetical protein